MFNMDFSKKLVIETESLDWIASPAKGVWRKPLEREEKESGHTTSVVKYDPESSFSEHPHPQGEEIFVLDGVFSDETGDFLPVLISVIPGQCAFSIKQKWLHDLGEA